MVGLGNWGGKRGTAIGTPMSRIPSLGCASRGAERVVLKVQERRAQSGLCTYLHKQRSSEFQGFDNSIGRAFS